MFCRKCGKELEDNWIQCPYCGESVNEKSEVEKKRQPIYKKWWFFGIIIVIAVGLIILPIVGLTQKKEPKKTEQAKVENEVELSKVDVGKLAGAKEEELKKLGFQKTDGISDYNALNGDVRVSCTDGKITMIMLSGDPNRTPSFCGVRLGDEETEAYTTILKLYPEEKGGTEEKTFLNPETKESVACRTEGGKIAGIKYRVLSEEEIAEYTKQKEEAIRAEYIFPDSDKKYLSEDEVRSTSVDRLYVGRNEIFARYGYIFEDTNLKQHFESTSWYQGTVPGEQFNADAVMNDFEKKNVELIKRIEDEINGVNSAFTFIGKPGVYCTIDSDANGWTGWIEILDIQDDMLTFELGTLTPDIYIVMTETAQITSQNTAQYSAYGFTITFTWSDDSNMFVTNSGELTGTDSGIVLDVTNRRDYTWSAEFNR